MQDHRNLRAFQHADDLVVSVYWATRSFPDHEQYGLTSQLRRAAVSVPTNIVEGCARETLDDYLNFLNIAFGSLREVGYLIDLSDRLGYVPADESEDLQTGYRRTSRTLYGLMQSLREKKE